MSALLSTARELGATQAKLADAEMDVQRLKARKVMSREAAFLLEQVYAQLESEDHPMADLVYQAECLTRGYRAEREAA